jgi:hypothetical protein
MPPAYRLPRSRRSSTGRCPGATCRPDRGRRRRRCSAGRVGQRRRA